MAYEPLFIYGIHPVEEALAHMPQSLKRVLLLSNFDNALIRASIARNKIPTSALVQGKLQHEIGGAVHQGIVAEVDRTILIKDYPEWVKTITPTAQTSVVILGEIQDPQNVGAIIRSAAAFGVAAVLIPEHNQAPITGSVIKASAGMAFRVPLVSIGNVNQTIEDLKKRGFWVYGLAGDASKSLSQEKFDAPAAFIVGNEGRGLREKTGEHCDILLSIPMDPRCESLNAAVSTAIVLQTWYSQLNHK